MSTEQSAESADVVSLDDRRASASFDACRCGSVWFNAAVMFEGGSVTSYAAVTCRECGTPPGTPTPNEAV